MMKKLLIILGIVVAVLAGGAAVLVANLDKVVNSKRDYLLDKAETTLGRDVTIDEIGVTLSRGIGVKLTNVAIADDPAFSSAEFVTAKDITIRVKFWPLLKKQVEVKRLVLNDPVINVIRDEEGVLNFASIARGAETVSPAGESATGTSTAPPAAATSLALAFADIKQGTIRYDDRQSGISIEINRVGLTVKNAGLGEVVEIEFSSSFLAEDPNIKLQGTVGPIEKLGAPEDLEPTPVHLEASIGPLAPDKIRGVLPNNPQLKQLDDLEMGDVEISLKVDGTLGALELSEGVVRSSVLGAQQPNFTLSAQAGPLNVTGAIEQPGLVDFATKLEIRPFSLTKVRELAAAVETEGKAPIPPELSLDGEGTLEASISGKLKVLRIDIEMDLTNGELQFADKFHKPAGVPFKATSKIGLSKNIVGVEAARLIIHDLIVDATGSIDLSNLNPVFDISVHSNESDVSKLADILPALQPLSVGGIMKLSANLKGADYGGEKPRIEGSLQIENGRAKLEQMPEPVTNVNATVVFTEKSARLEDTALRVGNSLVRAQGNAALLPLKARYLITSAEAHRTDFQTPPKPSPRPEVLRDVKIEGQIWQVGEKIQHEGTASSPSGTVANVDYRNMTAVIASTEDQIVIDKFSADVLGGKLEGTGTFEHKKTPPQFEMKTQVRKVNLAEYFKYKVESLPKFIEGTIDLDLGLSGAGKEWKEISPTLSGQGGALVIQGALLNLNFANDLLTELEQLPLVDTGAISRLRQNNPKMFSGNKTAFKDLKADVRIEGGRIHSKGLVLKTGDYSIYGAGWVSFDRQVNVKSSIVFSNQATQNIIKDLSVAKYLTNDKGQLEIPIMLTGPMTKPKILPDIDALSKKIQASALDQGIDKLRDRLGDELGDKAKDLLGGFGKKKSTAKPDTTKPR
jgi:uncharacterized protein involved in outer membrane biogenesis